ncbi:uncharacterized protein B0T23DRAFT_404046 [Neurospora hispaniola]|uniref:Uncharacterized protein n=1 Tax=Neurospora hispaniola TaxID=588809 RepID=A0AAJ0IB36_9PEZI|nr:hypothetical protein B0T23DRAFT_404046 [Neurospora hispaniola]
MSFFNEAFIAHSARAVHPVPPSLFYFGGGSDLLWNEYINACLGQTDTNDEFDAGNGLALNPCQVTRLKAAVYTTFPSKTSPRSTSSYHTLSPHTSPYGTSACPTPSTGTASVAGSPYTSSFQGASPHSMSPYSNPTKFGQFDDKDDRRKNHVTSLDGNIAMGQHNGGALAHGIPACPHPHNYLFARPREKIGTGRTCHKAIGSSLTGQFSIVAATNGFPPLNVDLSRASGYINNFESCRKPCPAHSYSYTHLTQTKGQMKQSGAGGFLNDKGHGFNFHLGNLPSYPDQSMSRHPGSSHENLGCTPGNAKNRRDVGIHDDHRSNRELRRLLEFQNWVLGLDASTMLRTAEQAGFPEHFDLGFESNLSNHGRMKSTEGQGMSTTALTSTPRGYSAENNTAPFTSRSHGIPRNRNDPASGGYSRSMKPTFSPVVLGTSKNCNNHRISKKGSPRHPELPPKATLHNVSAKSLPFRTAIASKSKRDDRNADKNELENVLTTWETRSDATVVPLLSGATPVTSTPVRAAVPRPGRGWKEEGCRCRCWQAGKSDIWKPR